MIVHYLISYFQFLAFLALFQHPRCHKEIPQRSAFFTPDTTSKVPSPISLKFNIADTEWKERFKNKLLKMPTSEAIYLLTTFSKMAESVSSDQKRFVHVISKEIYEVSA